MNRSGKLHLGSEKFSEQAQTLADSTTPASSESFPSLKPTARAYFAMEHITGLSWIIWGKKLQHRAPVYGRRTQGAADAPAPDSGLSPFRHIYHRDIKPGNILLTEEGTPVLIDFGAARHALKLHAATVPDHPRVFLPEQALGKTNIGPWSDLYSVRGRFYALLEILGPRRPYQRKDEMQPLHRRPVLTRYYSGSSCFPWTRRWPPDQLPLPDCRRMDSRHLRHFRGRILRHYSSPPGRPPPCPSGRNANSRAGKTSAAERPPPERTVFIPPHAGSPHALFAATAT